MAKILTKGDLELGKTILECERIHPVSEEKIFPKAVYWILSIGEKHEKQAITYHTLEHLRLLSPEAVLDENLLDEFSWAMKRIRFPNHKMKYIRGFSGYWLDSDIGEKIEEDASNGHLKGFELREKLYHEAPGIGMKCASCLLNSCGYDDLVPIDLWVLRWLKENGYEVLVYDYKTNGGFDLKKYLPLEREISDFAKKYNCPPAVFQAAIWGKSSDQSKYYLK